MYEVSVLGILIIAEKSLGSKMDTKMKDKERDATYMPSGYSYPHSVYLVHLCRIIIMLNCVSSTAPPQPSHY